MSTTRTDSNENEPLATALELAAQAQKSASRWRLVALTLLLWPVAAAMGSALISALAPDAPRNPTTPAPATPATPATPAGKKDP